ncbi:MAG: patatin-like phospholipase family protein [Actinomycetota bacterium]|nr:patatin-like phospholipase family protein [Actinomycetota bacterium]
MRGRTAGLGLTAFILAGGGNRGAVQVGMLAALVERDVYPDFILGTSVGALNGVGFAIEPSRASLARLTEQWLSASRDTLFPPARFGTTWRYAQKRPFVYPNTGLERFLRSNVPISDLSETALPVEIVATNAATGEPLRISTGDPIKALLATTALPGALPQIEMDGRFYIDGGISDDIPLLRAASLGATTVYVLLCGARNRAAHGRSRPIEAVLESFSLAKLARLRADIAALEGRVKVVVLESTAAQAVAWLDFSRSEHLIEEGYRETAKLLAGMPATAPIKRGRIWAVPTPAPALPLTGPY